MLVYLCLVCIHVGFAVAEDVFMDDGCHVGDCALSMLQRRASAAGVTVEEVGSNQTSSQPTRLRITNGCSTEPMWIAHMVGAGVGPDPQNLELGPGKSHDYNILNGMSSTRFWPKLGCESNGANCRIGESGGPGQGCPPKGCGPPVDTKFEATFGTVGAVCDTSRGEIAGCDWLDVSLVDGYTLPFKLDLIGDCGHVRQIDCSTLKLHNCPKHLRVHHFSGETAGCYSPCAQKTYPHWDNQHGKNHPWDAAASMYCCPTPPVSVSQCKNGPVATSSYVRMVHEHCPGVYGYAYDDAEGLSVCKSGVQYHVTFYCPR